MIAAQTLIQNYYIWGVIILAGLILNAAILFELDQRKYRKCQHKNCGCHVFHEWDEVRVCRDCGRPW